MKMSQGSRAATALLGLLFIIISIVLPSSWYFELPLPANIDRFPVTGITLFKTAFFLEGLVLALLSIVAWKYQRIPVTNRLKFNEYSQDDHSSTLIWGIFAIIGLALLSRTLGISQDFWLDEVATLEYTRSSLLDQLTLFVSPNNHVLNTLLIKLSIDLFGESEWSVRLPAVIFGIMTVPVLYWVAQRSFGKWLALAVSLLLAVSYHHIFFSQNARGYSAYLFLSLLGTGLFLRGLKDDKLWVWTLYITVMVLNFVALMNSVFVFLTHVTVGSIALFVLRSQGKNYWPTTRRLFFVFLALGLSVFHFYAISIPQIYVVLSEIYTGQAAGFSPFSIEFLQELVRGISAGFGTGANLTALPMVLVAMATLPFFLAGMAGFISFLKKDLLLTLLLLLPGIITGLYLVVKGLAVSPRFFLFELFFVLICAVRSIIVTVDWLCIKLKLTQSVFSRVCVSVVLLLAALSVMSLNRYYKIPKQSYSAAVEYIEQMKTEKSMVIVIYTAELGIAYYHAKKLNNGNTDEYAYVRTINKFNTALDKAGDKPTYIVTTFHRALGIDLPKIKNELEEHWHEVKVFPATIGDGDIVIWMRK